MIVNRGAVAAALERWNERRRRIFYPKTDLDLDLEALRRRKQQFAEIDAAKVASILDCDVRSVKLLPNAGTFHALFRVQTATKRYILKCALEESAFGFQIESWAMRHSSRSLQVA